MTPPAIPITATFMLAAVVACGLAGRVAAQSAPHAGDIPQSLRLEHDETLQRLTTLSRRTGPVGIEASKALTLF